MCDVRTAQLLAHKLSVCQFYFIAAEIPQALNKGTQFILGYFVINTFVFIFLSFLHNLKIKDGNCLSLLR